MTKPCLRGEQVMNVDTLRVPEEDVVLDVADVCTLRLTEERLLDGLFPPQRLLGELAADVDAERPYRCELVGVFGPELFGVEFELVSKSDDTSIASILIVTLLDATLIFAIEFAPLLFAIELFPPNKIRFTSSPPFNGLE